MKISYNWLKEFVGFNKSANELAKDLNLKSVAVEEVIQKIDDNIIIGEVLAIKLHPNADRLSIVTVNNNREILQIVCGAKNFKVGDKVPLAQIGARIGDIEITEAQIRGVKSYGMLCSERELNLSNAHEGIKILPDTYIPGKKLNDYIAGDALLDIEITPQRGDLLSHIGIAREIKAIYEKKIKNPEIAKNFASKTDLNVYIEEKSLCPQYYGLKINNIKIAPSPKWLKDRLVFLGIKPINNVVDITNYVLLELGQPLHAFDAQKIIDNKIIVRVSGEMEKTITLDGASRTLPKNSLVISDKEKILAIAGIMGAKCSEISDNTKEIILESAEFDAKSVRKSSKQLGLSTEASYRFERGINSANVEFALKRATKLITEIAGGHAEKIVSCGQMPQEKQIKIDYNGINSLLGIEINKSKIIDILSRLDFIVNNNIAKVPFYRHDLNIWQDLAEEIGRIYGYDKIKMQKIKNTKPYQKSSYFKKEKIKDELVKSGFTEIYNYIYLSDKDIKTAEIPQNNLIEIANPIQNENKYLRSSLIPGLLKNVAKNPAFDPILLFEFGNVFIENKEINHLGIIAAGKNADEAIKNVQDNLIKNLGANANDLQIKSIPNNKLLQYKIKKSRVYATEFATQSILEKITINDKTSLLDSSTPKINYHYISQFPPLCRDLAFIVDKNIDAQLITSNIKKYSDKVLLVELFDEFISPKFGTDKKNIAFHIFLQDIKKSLTNNEAESIIQEIIKMIKEKYSGKLRA